MPIKSTGDPRYPKRPASAGERMIIDGIDLGPSMPPQEIYILLRRLMDLDNDEIITAFRIGRDRVARDMGPNPVDAAVPALGYLSKADRDIALSQTADVSRSRLVAWRKRARDMTWLELRILLLGLHSVVLDNKTAP